MDNHQAPDGSVGMLYGRNGIRVRMPTGVEPTLIGKRPLPVYPDPRAAVEEALSRPVGCAPFEKLARGKKTYDKREAIRAQDAEREARAAALLPGQRWVGRA